MFRSLFLVALLAFGCSRDVNLGPRPDGGMDASTLDAGVDSALPVDGGNDARPLCIDEDDDGYGTGCALGPDCDDDDRDVSPGAMERCNGEDDDCDENVDEEVEGPACELLDGVCAGARAECGFAMCGASDYGSDYETEETRCDGLDNDCDGTMDEGCACTNSMMQACGSSEGACMSGMQVCAGGLWGLCEGSVGPVAETCNGVDDDCDRVVDNPADLTPPLCALQEGVCAGSVQRCEGATGWAACAGAASYGPRYEPSEASCDGVDNDCDGVVDEGCTRPVTFAGGLRHTCLINADGQVKCWGNNQHGQLGLGDSDARGDDPGEMGSRLPFVDLGPGRTAVSIAPGEAHTCALLDDASVKCWGHNDFGTLGLGDRDNRGDDPDEMGGALLPVEFAAGLTVRSIAAGGHTCALFHDNSVRCWGANSLGQLGLGDTDRRGDDPDEMSALPPVDVGGPVREITVGAGHSCALLLDGTVKCWGANGFGQLGQGDTEDRGDEPGEMGSALRPVELGVGRTAVALIGGTENDTCAILDDGAVKCWGGTSGPFTMAGFTTPRGDQPGEMGDAMPAQRFESTVVALAVGAEHNCAALADSTLRCWGRNLRGELGIGSMTRVRPPNERGDLLALTHLGTGRTASALSVGIRSTCARLDDGSVKCWGRFFGHGDGEDLGDEPGEMGDSLPVIDL